MAQTSPPAPTRKHVAVRPQPRIVDASDARSLAQRRLPRMVFDYIDGAAGVERAAQGNQQALGRLQLLPRVLADLQGSSLATSLMGTPMSLPFGIAPMGMCNLAWPGADLMLADAARERGMPLGVSTAATTRLETLFERSAGQAWFQLYVTGGVDAALALTRRAADAGYQHLVLTVDVPRVAVRPRDQRNGFRIPFRIRPSQWLDFALHPGWVLATLSAGLPSTANFDNLQSFDRYASRAGANWEFLPRLRDAWRGRLIVKGVLHPDDARRIQDLGVDAIYVSNHGGRQLDSVPPAIDRLPLIRAAVGPSYPLIFDSGVRSGEDVVKALACGANFVMIGRAALYAIAAGGERGLHELLDMFSEGIAGTLAQLGLRNPDEVRAQQPVLNSAVE